MDEIINFIQTRLYNDGTTGDGIELKTDRATRLYPYSSYTVNIKQESTPKRPIDRVTLAQTKEFYNSMYVEVTNDSIVIGANFNKQDGHIFKNFQNTFSSRKKFENSVLSLTEDEQKKMIEYYILTNLTKKFNEAI